MLYMVYLSGGLDENIQAVSYYREVILSEMEGMNICIDLTVTFMAQSNINDAVFV